MLAKTPQLENFMPYRIVQIDNIMHIWKVLELGVSLSLLGTQAFSTAEWKAVEI